MAATRPSSPALDTDRGKRERRRQIVRAATEVFVEAGYHGASINAIIERAQIARGTFYLYFDSKAAVFDSILDHAMTELSARIHRIDVASPDARPPQVQLREQLVATLEFIVGDRPLATLLLASGHTPEAEAAERLDQFFGWIRDLLEKALESGVEIGITRPCHTKITAAALLGMIRGVVEHVVASPEPPLVEDVVNELIAVALRGVLR